MLEIRTNISNSSDCRILIPSNAPLWALLWTFTDYTVTTVPVSNIFEYL